MIKPHILFDSTKTSKKIKNFLDHKIKNVSLNKCNLIIVIGEISNDVKEKIPNTVPIIYAQFRISKDNKIYKNQKITAFAGIAYPDKFYNSLEEEGAILEKKISYPDHHIFDENDMLHLAEIANLTKSVLVTTKKDFVRIPKPYRSLVSTLDGAIEFEDEGLLVEILTNLLENKINNLTLWKFLFIFFNTYLLKFFSYF